MAPAPGTRIGILVPETAIKALRPHTVFDNLHRVVQPKALGEGVRLRRYSNQAEGAMVAASTLTPTPIVLDTATLRR
jgi:hypothetical protein